MYFEGCRRFGATVQLWNYSVLVSGCVSSNAAVKAPTGQLIVVLVILVHVVWRDEYYRTIVVSWTMWAQM